MNNQTIKSKLLTTLAAFLITVISFGSNAGTLNANLLDSTGSGYCSGKVFSAILLSNDSGFIEGDIITDSSGAEAVVESYDASSHVLMYSQTAETGFSVIAKGSKVVGDASGNGIVLDTHAFSEAEMTQFFCNTYSQEQLLGTRVINYQELERVSLYEEALEMTTNSSIIISGSASTTYAEVAKIESGERYSPIVSNGFTSSIDEPLSTFSIDVDTASYAHMRRYLQQYFSQLPPKDSIRIEELINYFTYDYPQPEGDDPFSVTTEISTAPWNPDHQLVHIGLQGRNVDLSEVPASNLVFLIDTSGSMTNHLVLVKQSLKMLVDNLRDQDSISIVTYAGSAGLALPATKGADKDTIHSAIDNMSAGGSTAGGAGIELAYKIAKQNYIFDGNNRVILASDGDFNVGLSSREGLIKLIESKRDERIFLSVLGFGYGNYADTIMEPLADHGNGNYYYIDNLLEAKKVLVKEMGGTLYTIAKDVKIQVEFNPEKVAAYRLIGYENRLLNKEDFNNDKKDAGELGAGHTVTALYEIIPVGVTIPAGDVDELKYQQTTNTSTARSSDEVMTVKLRYKEPTGNTSKLITVLVKDVQVAFEESSDNFRFSSAVAALGMQLRDSEHKGSITFKEIQEIAKNAKGKDLEGYRAEFVRLVELAELLSNDTQQD